MHHGENVRVIEVSIDDIAIADELATKCSGDRSTSCRRRRALLALIDQMIDEAGINKQIDGSD